MRTKSLIIILVTLALGIFIGILGSNFARAKRIKEYRSYASNEGFTQRFLKVLEPTEEQKKQILPIIKEFSERNSELRKEYRNDFRKLLKEFNKELTPLLTKEQIEKLEQGRSHRHRDENEKEGYSRRKSSGHGNPEPPLPW